MNGSGKSNILNAILLLKKLSKSKPRHGGHKQDLSLNKSNLVFKFIVNGKDVTYKAKISYVNNPKNQQDIITAHESWNFKEVTGYAGWVELPLNVLASITTGKANEDPSLFLHRYYRYLRLGSSHRLRAIGFVPIDSLFGKKDKKSKKVFAVLREINDFLSRINYYTASQYTDPSESPASFELQDNELLHQPFGYDPDHIRFLYDLYKSYAENSKAFSEYLSIVGRNGIGLIDTIKFPKIPIPSNEVEIRTGGKIVKRKVPREFVAPLFIVNNTKLSPNQLSEGTFRSLALVFYLSTDRSRLLLVEEPEVCVHHGLLASVIELVKSYAEKKQIVMSTHSDFVLDHVQPGSVFLVKNERGKGTTVRHLPKALTNKGYIALREYLSGTGNLGEYWRQTNFQND